MDNVPFYSNDEDNLKCMLAVYSMIREHFEGRAFDWAEMIEFTGFQPKVAAWSVESIMKFIKLGYEVRMIEPFDYARYKDEGESYLKELLPPDALEWQLKNSNILTMKQHIPAFLENVDYEMRPPKLEDIDQMLHDGYLVNVMLNHKVLDEEEGYSAHSIVVFDRDDDAYICHDPGLPPVPNRRVKRDVMLVAMGGAKNTAEVTGYKR